jgi:hypothetical protein
MSALRRTIPRALAPASFALAAITATDARADGPLAAAPPGDPAATMTEVNPHAAEVIAPEGTRRFTVLVGVVSLPRPLAIEALVRIGGRVEVGLSAGALPAVPLQDPYRLSWLAVDAEGRFHPAHGASLLFGDSFFVALNVGYQSVTATNPAYFGGRIAYTTYGLFFAPRAGWAWTLRSGIVLGVDLGLAIPVLPATAVEPADSASVNTRKVSHTFGQNPMPYANLFRIGYSF